MTKVKWDEEGLSEAARQIASIAKRADRPPPEPKTPFASGYQSEDDSVTELRLSASASDSDHNLAVLSGDDSEREDFLQHRKQHYKQDGGALQKGRKLVEEEEGDGGGCGEGDGGEDYDGGDASDAQ